MNRDRERRPPTIRWALLGLITVLAVLPWPAGAQDEAGEAVTVAAEPGSELRVWLVTAAPGDAVWERYGHNAIRVLDTRTGRDVSYNWGIFDFQQVDFIPRFLQGRMLYMMAPFPTDAMLQSYATANREVRLQELALTPTQKIRLRDFAENNALPQNRDYIYQYFVDNCSTRARDLIDLVLDGRIRDTFEERFRGASYRFHTRRLTQVDPLIYAGMDLLLGPPTDEPISVWDEMFIPMVMADEFLSVTVAAEDGSERPLVLTDEVVVPSTRIAEPEAPPSWLWKYVVIGVAFGGLLALPALVDLRARRGARMAIVGLGTLWSALGGVLGMILVGLLFTDHVFSYGNENLFVANPLMLVTAVLLPLAGISDAWIERGRRWATLLAGVALIGFVWHLLPFSTQANGMHFALALPGHLGLAVGLRRRMAGAAPAKSRTPGAA